MGLVNAPDEPPAERLRVTPALDPSDAAFLAGFARQPITAHRVWPGQPAVPSPWVPCDEGCCLLLVPTRSRLDAAGQWLRFLVSEFLCGRHGLDGCVQVPAILGQRRVVLIAEGERVFEGSP